MPDVFHPPSAGAQIGGAIERSNRLERKPGLVAQNRLENLRFNYPGALAADVESDPEYVDAPTLITQVRLSKTVAAAGDTQITVRVDGSDVQTFTLAAGDLTHPEDCAIIVFPGQPLTVKTTATVSESGLAVNMRRRAK